MKDVVAAAVATVGASVAGPAAATGPSSTSRVPGRPLLYEALSARVAKQVAQLRNVFEGAEAKEHEREWLKFRQHGVLLRAVRAGAAAAPRLARRRMLLRGRAARL